MLNNNARAMPWAFIASSFKKKGFTGIEKLRILTIMSGFHSKCQRKSQKFIKVHKVGSGRSMGGQAWSVGGQSQIEGGPEIENPDI